MNPTAYPKSLSNYFKSKERQNMTAGLLMFAAALIIAALVIVQVVEISTNQQNFSEVLGWVTYFDNYMEDIAAGLILMLPTAALFAVGYLLLEGHPVGWKIAYAIAIATTIATVIGVISPLVATPIIALTVISATIQLKYQKENKKKCSNSSIVTENIAKLGLRISGIICICVLLGMIFYVTVRGSTYLNLEFITGRWEFLTARQALLGQAGEVGGVANFIIGSLLLVAICESIAIPLGLCASIYLSEYASQNRFTETIRFFIETLAGIPSVVIGLVGYMFFCNQLGWGVSMLAGGLSLMMMILPWNIRVGEEAMRAVPASYREGAYALGATQSQTIGRIILYASSPGVITGIILGIGGAIGETAVLLLTVGNTLPTTIPSAVVGNQAVPVLTIWISQMPGLMLQGGVNIANAYNIAYTGAFILIIIFVIICILGLIIRNYLHKKISGIN
jgi:phosphate transport system permease protein